MLGIPNERRICEIYGEKATSDLMVERRPFSTKAVRRATSGQMPTSAFFIQQPITLGKTFCPRKEIRKNAQFLYYLLSPYM